MFFLSNETLSLIVLILRELLSKIFMVVHLVDTFCLLALTACTLDPRNAPTSTTYCHCHKITKCFKICIHCLTVCV